MTVQELIDLLFTVKDKSKKVVIMGYGGRMNEICDYIESESHVRLIETDGDVEVELL